MRRAEAIAYRIHAQQLDRETSTRRVLTAADVLDFGVQDTGRDGASWALANRGVPVGSATEVASADDLALVWSLRASPHYYRRADLSEVLTATSPFDSVDAAKRIFDASKPLRAAGIDILDSLAHEAATMRSVVTKPMGKGEVSTAMTKKLDEPYVRWCTPCQASHPWENSFRLSALYAGLELEPGTSPPVLRRIRGWPRRTPGPAEGPGDAPARLRPIRNYLRFLGPATPTDVAKFLSAPVAVVKQHWPDDAVEVTWEGSKASRLADSEPADVDPGLVRLLGGFDLLLQGRDRSLLVPDKAHHKALWPTIGRPGAVLVGTEIAGTWRPRASGSRFTLRLELWDKVTKHARAAIEKEAEKLATHRGLTLAGIDES